MTREGEGHRTASGAAIETERLSLVLLLPETLRALLAHDLPRASVRQGVVLPPDFLPEDGAVVGRCGFHGPPRAVGRAEIGYAVQAASRGAGYATEAARALVCWAFAHGEGTVFASVAPANAPSLAVVRKVRFVQVGVHHDDGGEELVFEIRRRAVAA